GATGDGASGDGASSPAPLLRRVFRLQGEPHRIARARLYRATLGYGEVWLDGTRLGDPEGVRVLDPAPTDYDRTVLYTTDDVTAGLRAGGDHVLSIALGRG